MFNYNLKLALKSMRRNPIMTALMVAAIAVGIGISMTTLTVHYMMSGNPIPEKSDTLFAITLDSWNPLRPFDDDRPERGPHQVTFHDAERLVALRAGKKLDFDWKNMKVTNVPDANKYVKPQHREGRTI